MTTEQTYEYRAYLHQTFRDLADTTKGSTRLQARLTLRDLAGEPPPPVLPKVRKVKATWKGSK